MPLQRYAKTPTGVKRGAGTPSCQARFNSRSPRAITKSYDRLPTGPSKPTGSRSSRFSEWDRANGIGAWRAATNSTSPRSTFAPTSWNAIAARSWRRSRCFCTARPGQRRPADRAAVSRLQSDRDRLLPPHRDLPDHARDRHQARDPRSASVGRDQSREGLRPCQEDRVPARREPARCATCLGANRLGGTGRDPRSRSVGPRLNEPNRCNLETILRYTREQGMIGKMLALDDIFAPTGLGDAGGSEGDL